MRSRVLFAVACVQFACGDQQATSPTPTSTTVTISGRVRDSTTRELLAGAFVILVRPDGFNISETTDAAGYYGFANVMTGNITIRATRPSYDIVERQMTVTQDTTVDFVITPRKYTLSGRVTDLSSGAPLPEAVVTVIDGVNASRATSTAADGRYSLQDLWYSGFTLRIRKAGYDSVFRGVGLSGNTEVDVQMRVAQQTLAGTWTGELTSTGRVPMPLPEVTITQSGATIASTFPGAAFTGTLADASAIGSTTAVSGTFTVRRTTGSPRDPVACDGTGQFSGTVNWTRLLITAPNVVYSCGGTDSVTLSVTRQQ